jgi:hypothetical protein
MTLALTVRDIDAALGVAEAARSATSPTPISRC